MPFNWLRSLRPSRSRRRRSSRLANPTPLESRTLLSVAPIGGETKANSYTTGSQNSPAVSVDADGDYVVTWQSSAQDGSSSGIYAQHYNADGAAHGTEFRVNSYTTNIQASPAIGLDANGDFVITWASYGQDGSGWGIYAQRYNADGVAQGTEFRVNSTTTDHHSAPAIALDLTGDFVITWTSNAQDGSGYGV